MIFWWLAAKYLVSALMPGKYSNVNFYDYTHVTIVFGGVIYLKGETNEKKKAGVTDIVGPRNLLSLIAMERGTKHNQPWVPPMGHWMYIVFFIEAKGKGT